MKYWIELLILYMN